VLLLHSPINGCQSNPKFRRSDDTSLDSIIVIGRAINKILNSPAWGIISKLSDDSIKLEFAAGKRFNYLDQGCLLFYLRRQMPAQFGRKFKYFPDVWDFNFGLGGSSISGRCETREGALRESTAFSSAEARRLDQTHRHENAFPSALGEFRKSKLTRIRRKIRAGFSGVWNRTWLFRP
jgi:hypothetical protein